MRYQWPIIWFVSDGQTIVRWDISSLLYGLLATVGRQWDRISVAYYTVCQRRLDDSGMGYQQPIIRFVSDGWTIVRWDIRSLLYDSLATVGRQCDWISVAYYMIRQRRLDGSGMGYPQPIIWFVSDGWTVVVWDISSLLYGSLATVGRQWDWISVAYYMICQQRLDGSGMGYQ